MICMLFQEIAEEKKISVVVANSTAHVTLDSLEFENSNLISFFPGSANLMMK